MIAVLVDKALLFKRITKYNQKLYYFIRII